MRNEEQRSPLCRIISAGRVVKDAQTRGILVFLQTLDPKKTRLCLPLFDSRDI